MRGVSLLLEFCILMSVAPSAVRSNTVVGALGQELQTITQPVVTAVSYIGSALCPNVQRLLGVSYDQLQGPNEPDLSELKLYIRTKDGDTIIKLTDAPDFLLQSNTIDPAKSDIIVLYIHGFIEDPSGFSFDTVSQAYLDKGRVSVLALDASSQIRFFYTRAATLVRFIGGRLGAVLAALFDLGVDPGLIHLVAHSLGAHIAAFACKEFTRLTGRQVGRVTGLDPAGPCFSQLAAELRLKSTDATYVDVIHTDGGVLGLKERCG
nr:pancreatic triacylglycerol lipase-like [Maniola hyperantus]